MTLNIQNEDVERLVAQLAQRSSLTETEAVRIAVENELQRMDDAAPLRERLRSLQRRIAELPETGLVADKAFYDDLSGMP